jgi:hypothetical protein
MNLPPTMKMLPVGASLLATVGSKLPPTMKMLPVGASLLATMLLAMAGCAGLPTEPMAPPGLASTVTTPAVQADTLQLHEGDSRIELRLDRAGPLARLGHRHVIITNAVHGTANFDLADPANAHFTAAFRVDTLQIDPPAERAAAGEGFNTVLDAAAIAGTREHMLSPVLLDAARFPEIQLRLQQLNAVEPTAGLFRAVVVFAVKDTEFALPLDVTLQALTAGEGDEDSSRRGYVASGTWTVTHAQLGLTPYSAAGGLIKVADPIEVRFRLVAKPL